MVAPKVDSQPRNLYLLTEIILKRTLSDALLMTMRALPAIRQYIYSIARKRFKQVLKLNALHLSPETRFIIRIQYVSANKRASVSINAFFKSIQIY